MATYGFVWTNGTCNILQLHPNPMANHRVTCFLFTFSGRAYAIFRQTIESQMCLRSATACCSWSASGQLISIHGKSSSDCDKVPKTWGNLGFRRPFRINNFWVPHYIKVTVDLATESGGLTIAFLATSQSVQPGIIFRTFLNTIARACQSLPTEIEI